MALNFVEANFDYVSLANSLSSLQNVPGATLTAWVNMASTTGFVKGIIAFATAMPFEQRASLVKSPPGWRAIATRIDGDGIRRTTTGPLTTGVNVFLCNVTDYVNGVVSLYIDGVFASSLALVSSGGNTSNTASFDANLGAAQNAAGGTSFDGVISDVRVYKRALLDKEITTLYHARGKDSVIDGLVNWYTLNDAGFGSVPASVLDKTSGANGIVVNTPAGTDRIVGYRRKRSS